MLKHSHANPFSPIDTENSLQHRYEATLQYLFQATPVFENIGKSAYKPGLTTSHLLDAHFQHPHRSYATLHIAGTNGKGSCSHTLAAILQAQGYRVGLYTSPHLIDFRERIRVNGQPISRQRVIDFVEQEKTFFSTLHPSFFELTTALALLYFKEQAVDVAVIEVGLGGRLDCTNVITPLLSIITNISLDHCDLLGHTLAEIAGEKAGIIKPNVPVVVGTTTDETLPVFQQKSTAEHSPLILAEQEKEVISTKHTNDGGTDYETKHWGILHGELGGWYQSQNTNTLLTAVQQLNERKLLHIDREAVKQGLLHVSTTGLMGRWQCLSQHPLIICDTGHNVAGWQWISQQMKPFLQRPTHIVFGMVDDKDLNGVLALLPHSATYYWTQASTHRAIPATEVQKQGMTYGLQGEAFATVAKAYEVAKQSAQPDDFIFIGGSSYVVADLLQHLNAQH